MSNPQKLLDEVHSAIKLCEKVEKAQRGRRFRKRARDFWNWLWRVKPKIPAPKPQPTEFQFPFQKKG